MTVNRWHLTDPQWRLLDRITERGPVHVNGASANVARRLQERGFVRLEYLAVGAGVRCAHMTDAGATAWAKGTER